MLIFYRYASCRPSHLTQTITLDVAVFQYKLPVSEPDKALLAYRAMNHCVAVGPSSRLMEEYSAATPADVKITILRLRDVHAFQLMMRLIE